jgi:hypothetical protein
MDNATKWIGFSRSLWSYLLPMLGLIGAAWGLSEAEAEVLGATADKVVLGLIASVGAILEARHQLNPKPTRTTLRSGVSAVSIVLLLALALGCAGTPAAKQYAIAVESYTATVEASTPLVNEFVGEGDVTQADLDLVRGTFDAARTTRASVVGVVRACEEWTAANDGDPDCPQGEKVRAAARNIDGATDAITRIVEAAIDKAEE